MRRFVLLLLCLLASATPSWAQISSHTAQRFITYPSDPAVCTVGDVEYNSAGVVYKFCTATNTWTATITGGAGLTANKVVIGNGGPNITIDPNASLDGAGHLNIVSAFSATANPSVSGVFECAAGDVCLGIRNQANNGDITISKTAGDLFNFSTGFQVGNGSAGGISGAVSSGTMVYQGGLDSNVNSVLGNATFRGADITGAGGALSSGGDVLIRGGNNAATNAASSAGNVQIIPGASTGATQGVQGVEMIEIVTVKGSTNTQWNLGCGAPVNDCTATPTNISGVQEQVNSNTVQIVIDGQTPVNASAAVTLGHTVCAGATAGKVTDSGGTLSCSNAQGATVGIVLATSGTQTLPDGVTFTATTTLPLIQLPTAIQLSAAGGTVPLSSVSPATASNTIANANNPQTWNWAQTTDSQDALTLGETSPAIGGTLANGLANQGLLHLSTASASTATPFEVDQGSITGTVAFPALQIETTWNNGALTGMGFLLNVTDTSSAAASILAELNVANASKWKVDKAGNVTQSGTISAGAAPPSCSAGSSGALCLAEGTAVTGAASVDDIYADSTSHNFKEIANNVAVGSLVAAFTSSTLRSQILTADSAGVTATTPGTTIFTWGALPVSTNFSLHCAGTYSQATAAVANGIAVQGATNAPTRLDAWGVIYITNPASAGPTQSNGSLANLTTTTATNVVTATPNATATTYQWSLDGTIQVGASASTLNVNWFTGNASDAVTIKAGSYCTLMP